MKRLLVILTLVLSTVVLAACGSQPVEPTTAPEDGAMEEPPSDEQATEEEAEPTSEEQKVVTIFGAFVDTDAERFEASMAPFEERTGIDVQYEGSGDFESLITVRVEGGDPPDIAAFPQPGLMADFARNGDLVDLNTFMDRDYLEGQYIDAWLDLATVDDMMAGVWYRANVKSLVWYPVAEFENAGYEIPQTWDEMIALSDQMVADGYTPWCIGMESSGATGWVATDWIEDVMLRIHADTVYDQWVNHEIPFNSPEVQQAAEIVGDIWFKDGYVLGGTDSILTTPFGDSPTPLFEDPPGCMLHRQASFIAGFFPEGATVGPDGDVNFFYLPPIDTSVAEMPVLGAGDIMSMFNDRPEVRQVMEYLSTGESLKAWIELGGVVSPHKDAQLDWYTNDADRGYQEILLNASTFRFDGSDLMPGAVGAGTFWEGMVDWVSGDDLTDVLTKIEESWPE